MGNVFDQFDAPAAPNPFDQFDEAPKAKKRSSAAAMMLPEAVATKTTQNDIGLLSAVTNMGRSGLMFGYDDEIGAGMVAPIDAAIKFVTGNGFDVGKSYDRIRGELLAAKSASKEQHPVAAIAGELLGGLASGGGLAKAGFTLAGKGGNGLMRATGAAADGAGFGALYGAGNADEGERLKGAKEGALFGAATGLGAHAIGGSISKILSRKPTAPTVVDLGTDASSLYERSRLAGVTIKQRSLNTLGIKMKRVAGRINDKLRPKTAGIVDDLDATFSKDMSLEEFDELRQSLTDSMKRAEPQDKRTLTRMKTVLDKHADSIGKADITGDINGFKYIREARALHSRKVKSEVISDIFENAELDTSTFSQSGLSNTIVRNFKQLAKNKKKMAMFSAEERRAIKQIVKGSPSEKTLRLIGKFAPRGVVSTALGAGLGGSVAGPAGLALPAAGHLAAKAADRMAYQNVDALKRAVANGGFLPGKQLPNISSPFIGAATSGTNLLRQ